MTPLEKRALYGLVIGVVWAITFFGVFVMLGGVSAFIEDEVLRGIMGGIAVVGGTAYAIVHITYRKSGLVDERDRLVMIRASDIQLMSVFFAAGAWGVPLALIYKDEGIPVVFLFLMVISMGMVSMLAQAIGILFLSRRTEYLTKD